MEKKIESANNQKLKRLSIISSESNDYSIADSIDPEHTPDNSISPVQEDILDMTSIIKLALSSRGIELNLPSNPLETFSQLTSVICTEYLKVTDSAKEKSLNTTHRLNIDKQSISIHKDPSDDLLEKFFEMPETGLELSQNDCKSLIGLLVGIIRDTACKNLIQKIDNIQNTVGRCERTVYKLKSEIKEKDSIIEKLTSDLQRRKMK